MGAISVIIGLYIVLWGKAKDVQGMKPQLVTADEQHGLIIDDSEKDLEQPLLRDDDEQQSEHDNVFKCDKA